LIPSFCDSKDEIDGILEKISREFSTVLYLHLAYFQVQIDSNK